MAKKRYRALTFIAAGMLCAASTSFAQAVHTIQGRVSLPNGNAPLAPVRIKLTFNGMPIYDTLTDLSGRFFFSGLNRGKYQLTAEGDGETFETTKVETEIVASGGAPQTIKQNIQLRLKSGTPVSQPGITSVEEADLPRRAREEYQKGLKDAGDKKPENAIKHLKEAVSVHPQFYSAYVALAEQYGQINQYPEAAEAYQKALELKPDRAPAYVGLGVILVKQKKYADAMAPLRRSLEIEKTSSTAYLFLGLAEMMLHDLESSEQHLLRAYEIGKPTLAHLYLANLYDLKHEPGKAIDHLKAFLKENPNLPDQRQAEIRGVMEKLRKQAEGKK